MLSDLISISFNRESFTGKLKFSAGDPKLLSWNGTKSNWNKAIFIPVMTVTTSCAIKPPVSRRRKNNWIWFIIDQILEKEDMLIQLEATAIPAVVPEIDFVNVLAAFAFCDGSIFEFDELVLELLFPVFELLGKEQVPELKVYPVLHSIQVVSLCDAHVIQFATAHLTTDTLTTLWITDATPEIVESM